MILFRLIIYCVINITITFSSDIWPGDSSVTTVDDSNEFGSNLSGLYYYSSDTENKNSNSNISSDFLFAISNDPSIIYKLYWDGLYWKKYQDNGWAVGKTLAYMNSKGSPDSEDLTMDDQGFIFVCAERDNSKSSSSHLSILKYSSEGNATTLTAMEEWDLTKDLPAMDPNLGLEGITFISDDFLLSKKFVDKVHGKVYDPNDYPGHGNGLFFVGLEGNGFIYGYALMPNGVYHNICSVSSDETAIMSLEFDVSSGYLWATCDNHCNGRSNVFSISNSSGTFAHIAKYDLPSGMGNYNTEGFAIAPASQYCKTSSYSATTTATVTGDSSSVKAVFWSDDDCTKGHALRQGTVSCGEFIH